MVSALVRLARPGLQPVDILCLASGVICACLEETLKGQRMDFEQQRRIMVDSQIRVNDVTDPAIVSAFLAVPREAFLPATLKTSAYAEYELQTSPDRALWTPRDLAKMLRALDPAASDIALVVGAGVGYSAAVLAQITETVIALEDEEERVDAMVERFADAGFDSAVAVQGNLAAGLADQGPFDLILVAGMVESVPQAWLDQLGDGGRLGVVVSVGRGIGSARIYTRGGDAISYREAFECCPPALPGFEKKKAFVF